MQGLGEWIKEIFTTYSEYVKFWVVVNGFQEAVVLRDGKYHRKLGPGYHFKWPFAEYSYDVNVMADTMEIEPVELTTLDGKTVAIGLMLDFKIIDAKKFIIDNNDSYTNMRDIARGEMSDYLEDINWEAIKKKTTKNAITKLIKVRYEAMGIEINDLKFTVKCEARVFKLLGEAKYGVNAIYS